ncbi:MAG: RluA family pseudouridine synthase [Planctomycetes bacterium]|nr:RluA family pseudouridine synthase [Planctomycetota bacterium]
MAHQHDKQPKAQTARPERQLPKANPKIRVTILFDDGHVLALDKPAGLPTQPGRGHLDDTLVNAAFATHGEALSKLGADRDWGLLHRLDRDVGGVVLLGLTELGYDRVRAQFENRTVAKRYLAIVHHAPPAPTGRCTRALEEVIRGEMKVSVHPPRGGEAAETRWKQLDKSKTHAFLEVEPLTGRLHQIRAHLAMIGCPIVGDRVYRADLPPNTSRAPAGRDPEPLLLHAWEIEFQSVAGKRERVRSTPGIDLLQFARKQQWQPPV